MKKAFLTFIPMLFFLFSFVSLVAQYSVSLGINQPPELIISDLPDLTYSGDPVQLGSANMVEGGSGQYLYHWNPEEGLDDPNVARPSTSPEADVDYTLTVTDGNGCSVVTTQSITVDISDINNQYHRPVIRVYPVPTENVIHLRIASTQVLDELSVLIFDIAGHGVMNQQFQPNNRQIDYSIDMSDLEPGSYLMVVYSPDFISNHNIILY